MRIHAQSPDCPCPCERPSEFDHLVMPLDLPQYKTHAQIATLIGEGNFHCSKLRVDDAEADAANSVVPFSLGSVFGSLVSLERWRKKKTISQRHNTVILGAISTDEGHALHLQREYGFIIVDAPQLAVERATRTPEEPLPDCSSQVHKMETLPRQFTHYVVV